MYQYQTKTSITRAYLCSTIAYRLQVIEHRGREFRVALDLEELTSTGWQPMAERDLRDWCVDRDLPSLGLDRYELVRVLADHHQIESDSTPIDCDSEMLEYRMCDEDVDAFALMHGE